MAITTISSREFNQDASRAKRAANHGPVIITERGRPSHVLVTIDAYQRLAGGGMTLAMALGQNSAEELAFEPPRVEGLYRTADLD